MEPLDGRREGEGADGDGRRKGRGAAAALYGPGNKYRLNIREPGRMAAELRVREREQAKKVQSGGRESLIAPLLMICSVPVVSILPIATAVEGRSSLYFSPTTRGRSR